MQIENIDFYYLSMPVVTLEGDGSQDVLLVRVSAGGHHGWGECEASPLVSIAAAFCPRSHGACQPVSSAVLGAKLDSVKDIKDINNNVREAGLDLLQTDHTLSGIDIALWDLLARKEKIPVWVLMGAKLNLPKLPYASVLFGQTPEETYNKAKKIRQTGFKAAKFGWNGFGKGTVEEDRPHLKAAREGLGDEAKLMIDVGTVWIDKVEAAYERIEMFEQHRITWLEEPFLSGATNCYAQLAERGSAIPLAGGEGAHNFWMAKQLIDFGKISFVQIDTGRVGGITTAREVANYANSRGVKYVNHTFTSSLALSASLQPYVDLNDSYLAEYPIELKPVSRDLTAESLIPDEEGYIKAPDRDGLGMTPQAETIKKYLKQVRIEVDGSVLYETPPVWE
jgi:L-alanine-DL-glutamate epimerase-like enolase superfamily enzyme